MYREMNDVGLPEPEYRTVEFMVFALLKNHKWVEIHRSAAEIDQVTEQVPDQVLEQAVNRDVYNIRAEDCKINLGIHIK